jgi:nitrogen-specific signal transduction histidine kinase/CheY-like chemotaxis protein
MRPLPAKQSLAEIEDPAVLGREAELKAQAQRLEAIGRLAGGVAHDFNNLLTVILSASETLAETCPEGENQRLAQTSLEAARRGAELIRRLLAFSRPTAQDAPASADAGAAVEAVERLLRRTLPEAVGLDVHTPRGLIYCRADRTELESALLNLCINARDAMPKGGRLALEAAPVALDRTAARSIGVKAGDYVVFTVEDNGAGMSSETAERAVEPFFTTRAGSGGTGLGLSAVNSLAVGAGGALVIRSRLGQGSRITLYIPRARAAAQAELDLEPPPAATLAREVLLVEDDPAVRAEAVRLLRGMGCRVTAVEDGAAALEVLSADQPLDLMITDMGLPHGLDGEALADAARTLRPELDVLFTSGYRTAADAPAEFLPKPFGRADLAAALRRFDEPRRSDFPSSIE